MRSNIANIIQVVDDLKLDINELRTRLLREIEQAPREPEERASYKQMMQLRVQDLKEMVDGYNQLTKLLNHQMVSLASANTKEAGDSKDMLELLQKKLELM